MTFAICFVYDTYDHCAELAELCAMLRIPYSERGYNQYEHSMDRNYIAKLPAFHVIEGRDHRATLYPDADISQVEPMLRDYYVRKARRKQRSWRRLIAKLVSPYSKNGFENVRDVDTNTGRNGNPQE